MKKQISRRSFIKYSGIGITSLAVCELSSVASALATKKNEKYINRGDVLIAYFSHSGNTRHMAKQIHDQTLGDIFEIRTTKSYPKDYDTVVNQAKREQDMDYRPQLATHLPDLGAYEAIFVGYPNWWGTMPMALFTLLEENDFSGKTLIPFCTHEGSQFGSSVSDMKKISPQATILDGLAIRGGSVRNKSTQRDITEWLDALVLPPKQS